jgi:ribosome-associated translation inhibitor RaiA
MSRRDPFPESLPRATRKRRGRTAAADTPLAIRSRIGLDPEFRDAVRARLGRKLAKFATHIERLSLRFDDVNGPRGGVDTVCRAKAVLDGLPTIVVEEHGADAGLAFQRIPNVLERAVKRAVGRAGRTAPRATLEPEPTPRTRRGPAARDDDGSLIGRRVGRSPEALERALERPEKRHRDAFVDTAAPGTSASDRKAGYGATAARNTRRRAPAAAVALEDSRTTPSRRSTRKSANRMRASAALEHNESLQHQTPRAQAARAQAKRGRRGGRPRR